MLALVVLSSIQSIWIGLADKAAYLKVFPGAAGLLYYVCLLTSLVAGVNCVFIWIRKRWALWLNVIIGTWSIALVEIVGGPRMNELVILVACATTTLLPLALWKPGLDGGEPA
jgi:hypothetical protein